MHMASEMAPASGVPTLRSARGRALPTRAAGQRCLPRPCLRCRRTRATRCASRFRTPRRTRPLPRTVRARRASSCRRARAAEFDEGIVSGAQRAPPHPGRRRAVIAEPAAGRGQRRAPQHARRAAGFRRPGFSGGRQNRAGPAATVGGRVGGGAGRLGPADHAAAVVAVAGYRVDAAEFGLRLRHSRGDRH